VLFNSREFALFFPLATLLHFLVPGRAQAFVLLAAGCVFYSAFIPAYLAVLAWLIVVDYLAALGMAPLQGWRRRGVLLASLASNLCTLFAFKYYGFARDTVSALIPEAEALPPASLVLPLGLSFHTFQSMAYTIDVYHGRCLPERSFIHLGAYVLFYPQLVAGPIERPGHLLPQLHRLHVFRHADAAHGLTLMAWGFFKKLVIADRLAPLVDGVYSDPTRFQGLPLLLATLLFSYQIYCDFSGYSDIAVGAARVLGIRLMDNFDRPYSATSVADFWRRWHISLSTWFRDYVYVPLGGNRHGVVAQSGALLLTFLLSGLWHGANWTFLVWGALHAAYMILWLWTKPMRGNVARELGLSRFPRLRSAACTLATFAAVSFAWIFFRASTFADAVHVVTHVGRGLVLPLGDLLRLGFTGEQLIELGVSRRELLTAVLAVPVLELADRARGALTLPESLGSLPAGRRWAVYYAMLIALVLLGRYADSPFLYFQF
jgi:alginate O-acetyltransferase complex protein AlgI